MNWVEHVLALMGALFVAVSGYFFLFEEVYLVFKRGKCAHRWVKDDYDWICGHYCGVRGPSWNTLQPHQLNEGDRK